MGLATSLAPTGSVDPVCRALGIPRASFYRHRRPETTTEEVVSPVRFDRVSPRALGAEERQEILDVLHSPRFQDRSPTEVYATLLDERIYLGSERTFYRVLGGVKQ